MTIDAFLERFSGVRAVRPGQWTAECPAHEDRSHDTLSIALGADDRRLVYCWAGCETFRVLEAARLTVRDLFAAERLPYAVRPEPTTYDDMVKAELRRIQEDRARRFGPYRGELAASAAIREANLAAAAALTVAGRSDLDDDFRWELVECATEWERIALGLEAEQDDRFKGIRPTRG